MCSNEQIRVEVSELGSKIDHLTQTVFHMNESHSAFMQASREDRAQLNTRVSALESGSLSQDSVKNAVSQALTEHGVVTQQSLAGVAWRLVAGSAKRAFATMALASAGIGGGAALVNAVIHWLR